MKNGLLFVVVIVAALLTACGGGGNNDASTENDRGDSYNDMYHDQAWGGYEDEDNDNLEQLEEMSNKDGNDDRAETKNDQATDQPTEESSLEYYVVESNVRMVDAGPRMTIYIKKDGTIGGKGGGYYSVCAEWQKRSALPISDWPGIQQFVAGNGFVAGLTQDGGVRVAEDYSAARGSLSRLVGDFQNLQEISAGQYFYGLKSDGTVVGTFFWGQVSSWSDIRQVSAGHDHHVVGLKTDGTVVAAGKNFFGECDVENWRGIQQIAAGGSYTVGLKSDGTVIATGDNEYGQCDVENWSNIQQVIVGHSHTVGLRKDGTVVATGDNDRGQCNVDNWTNIQQIAADYSHTVGLMENGTVIAVGEKSCFY